MAEGTLGGPSEREPTSLEWQPREHDGLPTEETTDDRNTRARNRQPTLKLRRAVELAAATMYTSCRPCPMCTGAIARSGLGRVVFALSSEQLQELKPTGAVSPDAAQVAYEGPALFAEARVPVDGYYA